jgi:hypothetical protein
MVLEDVILLAIKYVLKILVPVIVLSWMAVVVLAIVVILRSLPGFIPMEPANIAVITMQLVKQEDLQKNLQENVKENPLMFIWSLFFR